VRKKMTGRIRRNEFAISIRKQLIDKTTAAKYLHHENCSWYYQEQFS